MVQMWQECSLKPPPVCTMQHELEDDGTKTSLLRDTRLLLERWITPIDGTNTFSCELFLLKKLVYKNKYMFKSEKMMQGMKQLQRCMTRFKEVDPSVLMKYLLDVWPSSLNLHSGASVYLPSRQMLEYVLVRLIGGAMLLHQSINRAIIAHIAMMAQIKIGMQIPPMTVCAATVSRIWIVSRAMKRQIIDFYRSLHPVLNILKPTQVKWLRDDSKLPDDLEAFLGKELGAIPTVKKPSVNDSSLGSAVGQSEIGEGESCSHDESFNQSEVDITDKLDQEDLGEVLQRDSLTTPSTSHEDGIVLNQKSSTSNLPQCSAEEWHIRTRECKSTADLIKLMNSLQKKYNIRARYYKECIKFLKDNSLLQEMPSLKKKSILKDQKKTVRICISRVLRRYEKLGRLLIIGRGSTRAEEVAKTESLKKRKKSVPYTDQELDDLLAFKVALMASLSKEKGFQLLLQQVKSKSVIKVENDTWNIPERITHRVSIILEMAKRKMKRLSEMGRRKIVSQTAKEITNLRKVGLLNQKKQEAKKTMEETEENAETEENE